jgi:tRNA 2-selenouridine synthase
LVRCSAWCQGSAQPSQKQFDTRVRNALRSHDPAQPVFVESGSKKIGDLRTQALRQRSRNARCLWLALGLELRVALLLDEYDFFVADTKAFCERVDAIRVLRGNHVVKVGRRPRGPGSTPKWCATCSSTTTTRSTAVDPTQFHRRRGAGPRARLGRQ